MDRIFVGVAALILASSSAHAEQKGPGWECWLPTGVNLFLEDSKYVVDKMPSTGLGEWPGQTVVYRRGGTGGDAQTVPVMRFIDVPCMWMEPEKKGK